MFQYPKRKLDDMWEASPLELIKQTVPPIGLQNRHPLFQKYGQFPLVGHEVGEWEWNEEALERATETELWQMIALVSQFWVDEYSYQAQKEAWKKYKQQVMAWTDLDPRFHSTLQELLKAEERAKVEGYYEP